MESYSPNELYHYGIKGMKWGVRRYQNKDGSLTNAGGKRYNGSDYKPRKSIVQKIGDYRTASKRKKTLEKARAAKAEKQKAEAEAKAKAEQRKKDVESGKISARNMTSEELNDRINKLNLEKRYKELMQQTAPEAKAASVGKKFIEKMWNDAVQPAAAEAGKQLLKDVLVKQGKKRLGLNDDNSSEILKKMADDWKNKADIAKSKKTVYENEKQLKNAQENDRKTAEAAKEGKTQYAEYANSKARQEESRDTTYSKSGSEIKNSKTYTNSSPQAIIKSGRLLVDSNANSLVTTSNVSQGKSYVDELLGPDGSFITYVKK